MLRKIPISLVLLLFLLFVWVGDRVLPQPLSNASLKTRTTIDRFFVGMFPSWKPKVKPYERTEKALKQEEQEAGGK